MMLSKTSVPCKQYSNDEGTSASGRFVSFFLFF